MTRPWRLGRLGAFAALVVVAVAQETQERSPPDLEGLFEFVSGPLVAHWLSDTAVPQLAKKDFPCMKLMILLDWVAQKYHNSFAQSKAELNLWKDMLVGIGFEGQTPEDWFSSSNYYALLQPVIEMQRTTQQVMEFLHVLVMVHGERCLYPDLRNNLGYAVTWAAKLSEEVHKIQLSAVYHSRMSLFETSTDVLRHLLPTIDVLTAAAQFADAFAEVRLTLDKLASTHPGSLELVLPEASPSPYQDGGGAFMDMTFIVRNLTNGWHLDHALLASLVRLWPPPASHGDGCHTSVADFGAGGGHYCKFFNKTGDYCCSAFDGSPKAALTLVVPCKRKDSMSTLTSAGASTGFCALRSWSTSPRPRRWWHWQISGATLPKAWCYHGLSMAGQAIQMRSHGARCTSLSRRAASRWTWTPPSNNFTIHVYIVYYPLLASLIAL